MTTAAFDPRVYFAPLINGTGTPAGLGPQIADEKLTHITTPGILYAGTGAKAVGQNFKGVSVDGDQGQVTKIYTTGGTNGSFGTGNGAKQVASFTDSKINVNVNGNSGAVKFTRCNLAPTVPGQFAFTNSDGSGVTEGSVLMDHCIVEGAIDASDPGGDVNYQYTAFLNAAPPPIFGKLWAGGLPGSANATASDFIPVEYCTAPYLQALNPAEVITQDMLDAGPVVRYVLVKSYTDPKNGSTDTIGNRVFYQFIAPGLADTTGAAAPSSPILAPHTGYFQLGSSDDSQPFVFNGGVASTDKSGTGGVAMPGTYSGPGAPAISLGGLNHADGLQWVEGCRGYVYRCYVANPANSPAFMKTATPGTAQPITGNWLDECLLEGGYNWWALLQHTNGPTDPNYPNGNSGYPATFYRNPTNQSEWIPYTSKLGATQPRAIKFTNCWWGPLRGGKDPGGVPITDGSSLNSEHLNFVSSKAAFTDACVRQYSGYKFSALQKSEIGSGIFDWAAFAAAQYVTDSSGNVTCPVLDQDLMNQRFERYGFPGMCNAETWVTAYGNKRASDDVSVDPLNYQDGL